MDISVVLAKFFALYFVVVLLAMLTNRREMLSESLALVRNPPVMLVAAIFTVLLGALLVAVHNVWVADWRVGITIVAWLTLLKGAWYLIYPKSAEFWITQLQTKRFFYGMVPFIIALTLFFGYYGFVV